MQKLHSITNIQFSPYLQPTVDGTIPYIQAKNFDYEGNLGNIDTYVNDLELKSDDFLKKGDILFAAKGFRNFAYYFDGNPLKAVASSMFLILKTDAKIILPEYLSIYLNQPKIQNQIKQLGAGSSIPSIRKSELGDLDIDVPKIERQIEIIKVHNHYKKEITTVNELKNQLEIRNQFVIKELIKNGK